MNNTIKKAIDILEIVGDSKDRGVSLSEIIASTGIAKSTVFDIVKSLYQLNFLALSQYNEKKYVLGVHVYSLGLKYTRNKNLVETCQKYLVPIAERFKQTTFVAILEETSIIYIYKHMSSDAILASCEVGTKHYAYTTALGKSLLAFIDKEMLEIILNTTKFDKLTEQTINSKEKLLMQINEIRKNGYSVDIKENEVSRVCYGAPVFDASGKAIAAISFSDLKNDNLSDEEFGIIVRECALKISHELGYNKKQYWIND